MNPFQRARDEATAVRTRLLKQRASIAVESKEILDAIEKELQIAVEWVAPTFGELGGGSAVLKREQQCIYVSNAIAASDERAALVAHEVGHWFLDAEKAPIRIAHLSSIAGTRTSPGVVTVEAYGARERQELQANVFARELLAPRALMESLFARGYGPKQIAQGLDVPIEYVRQQMLDALLLPKTRESAKMLHPPSDDQRAAARAKQRFSNVVAGPGTGKTSTLIHRVKYLIEDLKVDPARILVMTFTNKAALELVERLRSAGITQAENLWAGTFHAFGLEFLRKYHQRFDLDSDFVIADKLNAMTMLAAALPKLRLQHYSRLQDPYEWLQPVIGGIKRLKEELVNPKEYRQRIARLPADDDELRRRRADTASLYEEYEARLGANRCVDFVDLVAKPALAIRSDRASYAEIADKFQHILVDEYQDVTQAMVELLRELADKAESLWVVGDIRQAIHHWRGASVKSLLKFDETFRRSTKSNIKKFALRRNRRSTAEVLALVEQAGRIHKLESRLPLDRMSAEPGAKGPRPVLITTDTRASIPAAIHQGVLECFRAGIRYGEQTVLTRGSSDREPISHFLKAQGVPVLFVGELAEHPEVKRILCLMQLLSERQPRAFVGLLSIPDFALAHKDLSVLLAAADQDMAYQRGRFLSEPPPGLSAAGKKAIRAIATLLQGLHRSSTPWDFVCDLILERRFGVPDLADASIDASMSRIALWQFAYSVRNGDGEIKQARLPRYLLRQRLRERIGDTYAERELPPEAAALDAVRIQTIHTSKGLEFDAVHVGYVRGSTFGPDVADWMPRNEVLDLVPPHVLGSDEGEYAFEQAVERNNLFYVALSRARKHLRMYEDGEFVDDRAPQLEHYPRLYESRSFQGSAAPAKSPAAGKPNKPGAVEFERFEMYCRCPLQFSYRFELGLNREEDTDVAIRARWAIMHALREVAEGDAADATESLERAWIDRRLPEERLDPSLWSDAVSIYKRGLEFIENCVAERGEYTQPFSVVAGLRVELPWGFTVRTSRASTFHVLRFSGRGMRDTIKFFRPLLSGMPGSGFRLMRLHTLLPGGENEVQPSGAVMKTNVARAAMHFIDGDRGPRRGEHCGRCAYLTICPLVPG
jgi:superfamily I DNA/RNA helicase/Zn-dependent peptidase ImmA (M78 family)